MNQGARLSIFQKQMYRARNGHPAAMADVIVITLDDFPVFSNRVFVLKSTHNLYRPAFSDGRKSFLLDIIKLTAFYVPDIFSLNGQNQEYTLHVRLANQTDRTGCKLANVWHGQESKSQIILGSWGHFEI